MLLFLSLARFSVVWFQIDGVAVGSWPMVSPPENMSTRKSVYRGNTGSKLEVLRVPSAQCSKSNSD